MKILKVISDKTFKTKEGKEIRSSYFAILHDNGKMTPIKPVFDDGYSQLEFVSEKKFVKSKEAK